MRKCICIGCFKPPSPLIKFIPYKKNSSIEKVLDFVSESAPYRYFQLFVYIGTFVFGVYEMYSLGKAIYSYRVYQESQKTDQLIKNRNSIIIQRDKDRETKLWQVLQDIRTPKQQNESIANILHSCQSEISKWKNQTSISNMLQSFSGAYKKINKDINELKKQLRVKSKKLAADQEFSKFQHELDTLYKKALLIVNGTLKQKILQILEREKADIN
jgi:hypothetical protein